MWGRISFLLTASAVAFGVAGCQAVPTIPPSAADVPEARAWRAVATEQDRARIRGWYARWQAALADARAKGYGADHESERAEIGRANVCNRIHNAHLDRPI